MLINVSFFYPLFYSVSDVTPSILFALPISMLIYLMNNKFKPNNKIASQYLQKSYYVYSRLVPSLEAQPHVISIIPSGQSL